MRALSLALVLADRERIIAGELRGSLLRQRIEGVPRGERNDWIDAVLGIDPPPPDEALPRGAVPYLPCGVDDILDMVRGVPLRPDDELVDLGSGLGRVAILAHLLSDARVHGIEIQGHLVESAQACAQALGLDRVTFRRADVRDLELDGSVFFMYAPFNGDMLARVLDRLEACARRRRITVCTVELDLGHVPWLVARPASSVALTIYDLRQS